jgi:hypothetical protein
MFRFPGTHAIDEAHDTHFFAEQDEHPAGCYYCAIVREGRAALAKA